MILKAKTKEEIAKCVQDQKEYCERTDSPRFMPRDGVCWRCGRNIFQFYGHTGNDYRERRDGKIKWVEHGSLSCHDGEEYEYITGISNENAGTRLVTGCPHCNRSYCD